MQVFPTWRYHRTEEPKLVHTPEELEALGSEWKDSPAAFSEPEEKPADVIALEKPRRKRRVL